MDSLLAESGDMVQETSHTYNSMASFEFPPKPKHHHLSPLREHDSPSAPVSGVHHTGEDDEALRASTIPDRSPSRKQRNGPDDLSYSFTEFRFMDQPTTRTPPPPSTSSSNFHEPPSIPSLPSFPSLSSIPEHNIHQGMASFKFPPDPTTSDTSSLSGSSELSSSVPSSLSLLSLVGDVTPIPDNSSSASSIPSHTRKAHMLLPPQASLSADNIANTDSSSTEKKAVRPWKPRFMLDMEKKKMEAALLPPTPIPAKVLLPRRPSLVYHKDKHMMPVDWEKIREKRRVSWTDVETDFPLVQIREFPRGM